MSVKAVLFDLDATLLPMDQDEFLKMYFVGLTKKFVSSGYDGELFSASLKAGIKAIAFQDGSRTNEEAFWSAFCEKFGGELSSYYRYFEEFYEKDYDKIKVVCSYNPAAASTVRAIKALGFRVALATNPYFPSIATEKRMNWAGLSPADFELYTTFENSRFSKPSAGYYKDVADSLGVAPEECLMVGNDTLDDMRAKDLGMEVFLITDCLINKSGEDISAYPNGNFADLLEYVKSGI